MKWGFLVCLFLFAPVLVHAENGFIVQQLSGTSSTTLPMHQSGGSSYGAYQYIGSGYSGTPLQIGFKVALAAGLGDSTRLGISLHQMTAANCADTDWADTGYIDLGPVAATTTIQGQVELTGGNVMVSSESYCLAYFLSYDGNPTDEGRLRLVGSQSNVWSGGNLEAGLFGASVSPLIDGYFWVYGELGNDAGIDIVYPQNGSEYQNDFSNWTLSIDSSIATSTLKYRIRYGIAEDTYIFDDESFLYYSSLNGQYKLAKSSSLALSGATSTWYAMAEVYADYNGDGIFNNGVASSTEITFSIGSAENQYGYTSLTGEPIYYDFSSASTSATSTTKSCVDVIDGQASIMSVQGLKNVIRRGVCEAADFLFTPDKYKVDRFTALWWPLEYKVPFGYAALTLAELRNFASSTVSTSTSMLGASTVVSESAFFSDIADVIKTGISVLLWFALALGVIAVIVRIST